ncbi:MAG: hypothetical protein WC612_08480 [Bdellovibrionales bacterium]|jgi:hypothetical protein
MSYQIVHAYGAGREKSRRIKKIALILCAFFLFSLAGCGKLPPTVDSPDQSEGGSSKAKAGDFPHHYPDIKTDPLP